MPKYTFTFKKDDVFVDFSTTDRDVVERQFQIWVDDASAYTQALGPKKTKEKPATKSVEKKEKAAVSAPAEEIQEIKKVKEVVEKPVEEVAETPQVQPEETGEVFDQASTLLKTINTIQSEEAEPQKEVEPEVPDFEKVLENSMENPNFEPVKTRDINFLELINSKNTQDKFHYFIITAYYLLEQENLDRFSLKQINAKLMQNLSIIVDHTVLQDALNAGFVELVPDLTESSEASEYKLTEKGENFFHKEI